MRAGELKRLLSHGAIYAAGAMLARVVSFAMMPVYTRALSPAEYGIVDLLDTTAAVIVNLANVAITYSVMRFYYDEKDDHARGRVVSSALFGLTIVGGVAIALVWPMAGPLSDALFHTHVYARALKLMAVTAIFYGLIEVPMTYIRALERPGLYLAVSLVRLLVGLLLNVVFVVWLRQGVMGVVYANFLASLATVLALAAFTFPKTGFGLSRRALFGMMRFGLPFIPGSLAMLVLHNGDRYILNRFRSLEEVGIYSLGYKLGMIITYAISVPFSNAWSTRMYTVVREPDGMNTYSKVNTYFVHTLLFAWVALSVAAPEVVQIAASPKYASAALVVPVIAGGYVMREASESWKNAFMIQKRTAMIGWIQPVIAVANIASTWFLVQRYGAMGAAWATALTFLLLLVLTVTFAERVLPTRVKGARLAMSVVFALGLFGLSRAVPPWSLAASAAVKLVIVAMFPVLLFVARVVPRRDRASALASMMQLRARVWRVETVTEPHPAASRSSQPAPRNR